MSWKKTIAAAALTAAVSASAMSAVSAATPVKTSQAKAKAAVTAVAPINVMSSTYVVNGKDSLIHAISWNGKKLVSVHDLAVALGADLSVKGSTVSVQLNGHTVKLSANSDKITVDGLEQKLAVPVKNVKYNHYIDLDTYLQSLSVTVTKDASGAAWIDADLLSQASHAQWAGDKLIVAHETEAGTVKSLVDVKTGECFPLLNNTDASELVLSPDGKKAAYSDSQGAIYVLDLEAKASSKVSADVNIKPELVWSADGSTIYFLQGDKGSVISKLDLASGTITKVLDDKVDYKSNLNVSTDGKTFTYAVTVPPKVTDPGATEGKDVVDDGLAIDTSAAATNIFQLVNDPSIKDNKPVQLTNTNEEKTFIRAAADGSSVTFINVGADEKTKSVLTSVAKDKTVKNLFGDQDVLQAVSAGSTWYLLTGGTAGKNLIYEFDAATGVSKELYTVPDTVSEIIAQGSSLAIIQDGILYAQVNGKWRPVSR